MKYELDDPKITAYALGELDNSETAAMEVFLNENEAVRDEVARIREAAQWLTAELGAEAPEGLSELERARIVDQAKADAVYAGVDAPLVAEDIAEAVRWIATLPEHVSIDRLVIRPRAQASNWKVARSS